MAASIAIATNNLPLSIGAQSDGHTFLPGRARPGACVQPGAVRRGDRRPGGRVAAAHRADLHRPATPNPPRPPRARSRSRRCGGTPAHGGRSSPPTASGASSAGTWLWKLDGTTWTEVLKLSDQHRRQGRRQGRGQRDPRAALRRHEHATGLGPVQRRDGHLRALERCGPRCRASLCPTARSRRLTSTRPAGCGWRRERATTCPRRSWSTTATRRTRPGPVPSRWPPGSSPTTTSRWSPRCRARSASSGPTRTRACSASGSGRTSTGPIPAPGPPTKCPRPSRPSTAWGRAWRTTT